MTTLHLEQWYHPKTKSWSVCFNIGVHKWSMYCIPKHSVSNYIIGKATDLKDFDKGQIVKGMLLESSISETVHFVYGLFIYGWLWACVKSGLWMVKQHISDLEHVPQVLVKLTMPQRLGIFLARPFTWCNAISSRLRCNLISSAKCLF